jgi:ABC-2 type transport system ATP-binding protein
MPSLIDVLTDPISLTVFALYAALIAWEWLVPARPLPRSKAWAARGLIAFAAYFLVSTYLPLLLTEYLQPWQLFDLSHLNVFAGATIGVLAYELVGYFYHRSMHASNVLWRGLHQMHHSAERIDTFGAFWFHPTDMIGWTVVSSVALTLIVGLSAQAGVRINRLSGGQRRRLDVAIGIVGRPEMLFIDEPTVGFDPAARREFHDLVHRLTDVDDTTILLTTHDLDEAEKLADRIVILAGGRIIADGSADQLSRRVAGESEIRWTRDGARYVHSAADATRFVRELLLQYGEDIADLEVRRTSLEDSYMTLVRDFEAGRDTAAASAFEVIR